MRKPIVILSLFFVLQGSFNALSQTVTFHNLAIPQGDTVDVDLDGDLYPDIKFTNTFFWDAAFMKSVAVADSVKFSSMSEDSTNFSWQFANGAPGLAMTQLVCNNWGAGTGFSMNVVKHILFYKKYTPTDSVFGYVKYMPYEGPFNGQCSDDTLYIYKSVIADVPNTPIYPGPCNHSFNQYAYECFGDCLGEISINNLSGLPPYTYDWSNGETTNNIDSLCAGMYTVTVTDNIGCEWTDSIEIENFFPVSNVDVYGSECMGQCLGQLTANAFSGFGHTYSWDNGDNGAITDSLCMGWHYVTITEFYGCSWQDSAYVDTTSFGNNFSVTGNFNLGPCDLDAEAVPNVPGTYTYNWSTGSTTNPEVDLCDGWHSVTITNEFGCELEDSVYIDNNALTSNLHPNFYVPAGGPCGQPECNGQFAILINNGTPPYTIDLSNGSSYTTSYNYLLIDSLCADSYSYVITDSMGQTTTNFVVIEAVQGVTGIEDTVIHVSCPGAFNGSVSVEVLTGQGPFLFSIDGGITYQNSNLFTNMWAGGYTVLIQDANGCTGTVPVNIHEPPPYGYTVSHQNTCSNSCDGSILVDNGIWGGTPPYTYSKDNGLTYQASAYFGGLCQGNVDIVVKDDNGCLWNTVVAIGGSPPMSMAPTFIEPLCHGYSDGEITFNASGGTPPYSYSVDNGTVSTTDPITNIAAGPHELLLLDSEGCEFTGSITVTEPPALVFNYIANNPSTCGNNDGSFEISAVGGCGPYFYSIDGGTTIQVNNGFYQNLYAGLYTLYVWESCEMCPDSVHVAISDQIMNTQTDFVNDVSCYNSCDGSASVSQQFGAPPFTYTLDFNTTSQPTGVFTGLCAGQHFVTVEDAGLCLAIEELNIMEPDEITFDIAANDAACSGASNGTVDFNNVLGGDGGPYTYSVDGSTYQGSPNFTNLASGNYTGYVQDGNGCLGTLAFEINSPDPLIGNVNSTDISCFGDNNGFIQVIGSGGTTPYTYTVGGNVSTNGIYPGLSGGTYPIEIMDANGCIWNSSIIINEPAQLVLNITSTNPDCNGISNGTVILSASGGTPFYQFTVDGGNGQLTYGNFNFLNAGSYNITLTDVQGCTTSGSATLTDPVQMAIDTTNVLPTYCTGVCNGVVQFSMINGTSPYTIQHTSGFVAWNTMDDFTIDSICAGTLTINVYDDLGCFETVDVLINGQTDIQIDTSALTNVSCFNDCDGQVTIDLLNGTSPYSLNSTSGNISLLSGTQYLIDSLCAGSLLIQVMDDSGCTASTGMFISEPTQIQINTSGIVDPTCFGDCDGEMTVDITNGTAPYTVSSNSGSVNMITGNQYVINGLCEGNVAFQVTDDNGCIENDSASISQPDSLYFTYTQLDSASCTACNDGSAEVTIFGGTAPYTVDWSDFGTSETSTQADSLSGGSGVVCVTDANGCQFCDSVTVDFIDDIGFDESAIVLQVFPNPSEGDVTINCSVTIDKIDLFDLQGKLVNSIHPTSMSKTVQLMNLSNGIYMVQIYVNDQTIQRKLVVH